MILSRLLNIVSCLFETMIREKVRFLWVVYFTPLNVLMKKRHY